MGWRHTSRSCLKKHQTYGKRWCCAVSSVIHIDQLPNCYPGFFFIELNQPTFNGIILRFKGPHWIYCSCKVGVPVLSGLAVPHIILRSQKKTFMVTEVVVWKGIQNISVSYLVVEAVVLRVVGLKAVLWTEYLYGSITKHLASVIDNLFLSKFRGPSPLVIRYYTICTSNVRN